MKKSLFFLLLLMARGASAVNLNITDLATNVTYPFYVGGGTWQYYDDGGQSHSGTFGAKWDYGPGGPNDGLWSLQGVTTSNQLVVNFTWNSPGSGPGSWTVVSGPGLYQGVLVPYYASGYPCQTNWTIQTTCPKSGDIMQVNFSDGTVEQCIPNDATPGIVAFDQSLGPDKNGYCGYQLGSGVYYVTGLHACNVTYTISWVPFSSDCLYYTPPLSGNGTNGFVSWPTNSAAAQAAAGQDNSFTNVPLASVPPDTSSNILWSNSGSSSPGSASSQDIHDLGNGLNNTLWSAEQQSHDDDSAVVGAIDAAKSLAHYDAGKLKQSADTWGAQAHRDATAILGALQNLTVTNTGGGTMLTNYALNSTLGAVLAVEQTNYGLFQSNLPFLGGLAGAMTNLSGSLSNLTWAITNAENWTNLDIASETTLEGVSNILQNGGTNFGRVVTNYALETTQEGISNVLSQILSNALAGTNFGLGTNGLTLAQLTNQVNEYTAGLTNSQDGALAQMSALTNQAGVMGMNSVVSAVQDGLPGNVEYAGPGSVSPQVITLASGVSFSLGSNLPSYGPLRQVLAWATIVGLFMWNWRTTYSKIRDVFSANQARTSGTEILGSNVNLSSALLMAVAIFAAATAIPTFAVAVLTSEVSLFVSVGNPLTMFGGFGWGFSFLDQYIPLATVISAVTTRVVFNVVIDSIAAVVMGIKLFLVGL